MLRMLHKMFHAWPRDTKILHLSSTSSSTSIQNSAQKVVPSPVKSLESRFCTNLRKVVSMPVYGNKVSPVPAKANKLRQLVTMCMAFCEYSFPPLLILPFCCTKSIFKMNCANCPHVTKARRCINAPLVVKSLKHNCLVKPGSREGSRRLAWTSLLSSKQF